MFKQAQLLFAELLQAALEQVKSCECTSKSGCPNCVQVLCECVQLYVIMYASVTTYHNFSSVPYSTSHVTSTMKS